MSDSTNSNHPALSVSELSANLKRTIETNFDHVVVRGELGRVTIPRSGHMYADIKDDKAVLNTVMWKGQVDRLPFKPEEGLEVIVTGKLSIYAGRSNYQMLASSMRPAGAGALMQLLEERKKKLAAEGLFDPAHKVKLPFMPKTVGVVTSPTGAVIRDILHRIRDRFPVNVVVWPALVQGDNAAAQITAGIEGFNALTGADRPDVVIVARGGGSIEDLWPFNEENVVRAAFNSSIPLISAVGHETDTTLIDYVSDARAPTPTGAAEIAVPVRSDLIMTIDEHGARMRRALSRRTAQAGDLLKAARLPRAETLLQPRRQRLDYAVDSLPRVTRALIERKATQLHKIHIPSPRDALSKRSEQLGAFTAQLDAGLRSAVSRKDKALTQVAARLRPEALARDIGRGKERLRETSVRARPALNRILSAKTDGLSSQAKLLETLSYQATLKRGYSIVRDSDGRLIRSASSAAKLSAVEISFADGDLTAQPIGKATLPADGPANETPSVKRDKPRAKTKKAPPSGGQGNLF
ncbi:MAG: exodeoxyribonuclease VII large subunit [Hyphomonas sp.]